MSALDDLIETHLTEVRSIKKANRHLHERAVAVVAQRLGCPVQAVKEALYQVSIQRAQKPVEILDALYDVLAALAEQKDTEEEP